MKTAYNPETDELLYLDNNQWKKSEKTATDPETGEKAALVNNKWIKIEQRPTREYITRMEGFMSRVPSSVEEGVERYGQRMSNIESAIDMDPVTRAGMQAGTATAVAAEVGGEILSDFIISSVPNSVREGAEDIYNSVKDTPPFQLAAKAAEKGYQYFQEFKESNPAAADLFMNAVDLGSLFSPRPDLELKTAKRKTRASASKAKIEERKEGITSMIQPDRPDSQDLIEEVGVLRRQRWVPKSWEDEMVGVLETIDGIDPNRSYTHNMNVLHRDIADSSKRVEAHIKRSGNPKIDGQQLLSEMNDALDEFKDTSGYRGITPEAQKIVDALAEDALQLVSKQGNRAMGLLKARQEFDKLLTAAYNGVLEPSAATGRAKAAQVVRSILNEKLKSVTKGDEIHHLLNRQHNSFLALDRMANKRAKELDNALSRGLSRVKDVTNLPTTPLALYATVGTGLGAIGGVGPAVAGAVTGGLTYAALRQLSKPKRKQYLASMVSGIDKLIKKAESPSVVSELKMDRMLLVDALRMENQEEDDE